MGNSKYLLIFLGLAIAFAATFVAGTFVNRGYDDADIADARREGGDSATAAVSTKYLNEVVKPMQDSIDFYKAKPQAAAKIVVRRDTVRIADTITLAATPVGDSAVLEWPLYKDRGVAVAETLTVAPAPPMGTRFRRALGIAIAPDTILAALLRLPGGSQRFSALALGQGYVSAEVVDAARRGTATPFLSRAASVGGTGACVASTAFLVSGSDAWVAIGSTGVACLAHVYRELTKQ